MRGSKIIVTGDPKGVRLSGIIGDTSKPGTCMQLNTGQTVDKPGGFTWIAAAPGTDGKGVLHCILLEDRTQGKLNTDAFVSGTLINMYCPLPGEDMNVIIGETAGTGNSFNIGDRLIINATAGYYIPETGSPQQTSWLVMEKVTQVAASYLTWCKKT